jgi:hypothetical protein
MNGSQFITHITRTRLYQDALLQTAEDLQAAAHFNNTVEFVVDAFGALSKERTTGELCVLTNWRVFYEAENMKSRFMKSGSTPPVYSMTTYNYWRTKGMSWPFKASRRSKSGRTTRATTSQALLATPIPVAMPMVRRASSTSNYLYL